TREATPADLSLPRDANLAPFLSAPLKLNYPQRESVLFALRELTEYDAGASVEAWRTALSRAMEGSISGGIGFPGQPPTKTALRGLYLGDRGVGAAVSHSRRSPARRSLLMKTAPRKLTGLPKPSPASADAARIIDWRIVSAAGAAAVLFLVALIGWCTCG